jgi:dTDP-glucose pyrophosphorylase
MRSIDHRTLGRGATLRDAFTALNRRGGDLIACVLDEAGRPAGTITDGDLRRAMLAGAQLDDNVERCMNPAPFLLQEGHGWPGMVRTLHERGIRSLPMVDADGRLTRVVDVRPQRSILPIRAMIMAGGKGRRLLPLTENVPKPLVPVHGRPIIDHVLELLDRHGVEEVHIAVNHLKEQIMAHLGDGGDRGLRIGYVEEQEPLGTAGSLASIGPARGGQGHTILLNGDLLTDVDVEAMLTKALEQDADLVVASTEHLVDIPYAVLEISNGTVVSLSEKPTVSFPCNAGIYLIHDRALRHVPAGTTYNATDLVLDIIRSGGRVVHHSIVGLWFDIGRHDDLERASQAGMK